MNLKHIYWRVQSKVYKFSGQLFRWLPVKRNKIVLNNFYGFGFGDSPKYIVEEIIRQRMPYDIVWLVSDMNSEFPSEVRKVKLLSFRASYELSTAKIIISNVKVALPYHKKRSQYYIQTWHGSMAFKAIEADAQDKLDLNYLRETKADSKLINLFLSSNSIQTQEIQTCFWYDGEIFESGSPRNDMFYKPTHFKDSVKRSLGLPPETKVVLFAPTFRDNHRTDVYNLDFVGLINSLTSRFGGDWRVLVRLHPNLMGQNVVKLCQNSIDVASYPDMQELLLISDILITDYSTTIYDAIIMHKTVLLYAPDLEEYCGNRGLKSIYFSLPSQVYQTNEELFEYISKYDETAYQQQLDYFLSTFRVFDDGNASKRVVDRINKITKLHNL